MRAELLKIRTTVSGRTLVAVLALGGALLLVVSAAAPALLRALIDLDARHPELRLTSAGDERYAGLMELLDLRAAGFQLSLVDVVSTGPFAGSGSVGLVTTCALLVGVLVGAGDFRHGGIVAAALTTPDRLRLVANKAGAVCATLAGAGIVLVAVSVTALTSAVLPTPGAGFRVTPLQIAAVGLRGVLVLVLLGLVGLGLGLLIRHVTVAVVLVFAVSVAEPVLAVVARVVIGEVPTVIAALPLSASQLATRGSTLGAEIGLSGSLSSTTALLTLTGWAALTLAAGAWRTHHHDLA